MVLKRPKGQTFLPYSNIEELVRVTSQASPRPVVPPPARTKPQRARPNASAKEGPRGMKVAIISNGGRRYAKRRLPADYIYAPPPPRGSLKRDCKRKDSPHAGGGFEEDDSYEEDDRCRHRYPEDLEEEERERSLAALATNSIHNHAIHNVVSPGLHHRAIPAKRPRHRDGTETPPSSDDSMPLSELAILNGHSSGATQSLLVRSDPPSLPCRNFPSLLRA